MSTFSLPVAEAGAHTILEYTEGAPYAPETYYDIRKPDGTYHHKSFETVDLAIVAAERLEAERLEATAQRSGALGDLNAIGLTGKATAFGIALIIGIDLARIIL